MPQYHSSKTALNLDVPRESANPNNLVHKPPLRTEPGHLARLLFIPGIQGRDAPSNCSNSRTKLTSLGIFAPAF